MARTRQALPEDPLVDPEDPLTDKERAELERLEGVISAGLHNQLHVVAPALREIRRRGLYRASGTFAEYVHRTHGFKDGRARQLIDAADLVDGLKAAGVSVLPVQESQCRPLLKVTGDRKRKELWEAVLAERGDARAVQGSDVAAAVDALKGPSNLPVVHDPYDDGSPLVLVPRSYARSAPGASPSVLCASSALTIDVEEDAFHLVAAVFEVDDRVRRFSRPPEAADYADWSWDVATGYGPGAGREWDPGPSGAHYPQGDRLTLYPDRLLAPKQSGAPGGDRVLVCPHGDLLQPGVPDSFVAEALRSMESRRDLTFVLRTRHPQRLRDFVYPANAWVGAAATCQDEVDRAERALQDVRASVCALFVEPVLERVALGDPGLINFLVIGGQLRTGEVPERQPEAEWVEALRSQCDEHGVAVWEAPTLRVRRRALPTANPYRVSGSVGRRTRPEAAPDRPAEPLGAGPAAGSRGDGSTGTSGSAADGLPTWSPSE